MENSTVRIEGLTKFDTLEIGRHSDVTFEEASLPEGSHGEVTVFAAIFAMSALSALAAYLLRKHNNKSFEETVEIQHPDGRREKRTVRWSSSKSEAPEADIIRQIQRPTI